jgi:hypothetical protein
MNATNYFVLNNRLSFLKGLTCLLRHLPLALRYRKTYTLFLLTSLKTVFLIEDNRLFTLFLKQRISLVSSYFFFSF